MEGRTACLVRSAADLARGCQAEALRGHHRPAQTSTYGTRQRINLKLGLVECDDGVDLGCSSQVGNPLGHQGCFRSPVRGLYDFRARLCSTGMRVC